MLIISIDAIAEIVISDRLLSLFRLVLAATSTAAGSFERAC